MTRVVVADEESILCLHTALGTGDVGDSVHGEKTQGAFGTWPLGLGAPPMGDLWLECLLGRMAFGPDDLGGRPSLVGWTLGLDPLSGGSPCRMTLWTEWPWIGPFGGGTLPGWGTVAVGRVVMLRLVVEWHCLWCTRVPPRLHGKEEIGPRPWGASCDCFVDGGVEICPLGSSRCGRGVGPCGGAVWCGAVWFDV